MVNISIKARQYGQYVANHIFGIRIYLAHVLARKANCHKVGRRNLLRFVGNPFISKDLPHGRRIFEYLMCDSKAYQPINFGRIL